MYWKRVITDRSVSCPSLLGHERFAGVPPLEHGVNDLDDRGFEMEAARISQQ